MTCGLNPPLPDKNIPVVCFDLDSTLAESVWPERGNIGKPIPEGVALLHHYAEIGYRVEILTARPAIDEDLIWEWIRQNELPVDAVTCGKPFAGLYLDDRAYCPPHTKKQRRFELHREDGK